MCGGYLTAVSVSYAFLVEVGVYSADQTFVFVKSYTEKPSAGKWIFWMITKILEAVME